MKREISSGPGTNYPREMKGLYLSTDQESMYEPELTRDLLSLYMK